MSVSVSMPQLGESVTEGTVTRWLKKEGERVERDEPLLEISTDKVDTEIPSPAAGILRGIVVAEDETVAVGAELALIDEDEGAGQPAAAPAQAGPASGGLDSGQGAATSETGPAAGGPDFGPGAADGPAPGGPGGPIPAPAAQEPAAAPAQAAAAPPPPAPSAPAPPAPAPPAPAPPAAAQAPPAPAPQPQAQVTPPSAPPASPFQGPPVSAPYQPPPSPACAVPGGARGCAAADPGRRPQPPAAPAAPAADGQAADTAAPSFSPGPDGPYVTPLVRKLAAEHGVNLAQVSGTGVGGRIRKQDVLDTARARRDAGDRPGAAGAGARARRPGRACRPARPGRGGRRAGRMSCLPACVAPPSTCHGFARSSPSGWWSRCRLRRSSPPWSRRT